MLNFDTFLRRLGRKQVKNAVTVDHVDAHFDKDSILALRVVILCTIVVTVDLDLRATSLHDVPRDAKPVRTASIDRQYRLSVRPVIFNDTASVCMVAKVLFICVFDDA